MKILQSALGVMIASLGVGAAVLPATPAGELPVATFFQAPAITSLTFSPNGKYIACLVPYERRMNLLVIDLEKGTKNLLTNFKDRQAEQPIWANDERILFRVDDEGREAFALYAVNRDGSKPVVLASGYSKAGTTKEVNVRFRSILGRIEGDSKNILVLANLTYRDWSDVATMNVQTGEMTTLITAPGPVDYYLRDRDGHVRIAVVDTGEARRVLYREAKGGDWSVLGEEYMDKPGWSPLAIDGDNRTLFVASHVGRKTNAIYRYDTQTRTLGDLVFGDDTYDVENVVYDEARKKVIGVSYQADRLRFHWIDPEAQALQKKLDASLPDTVNLQRHAAPDGSKRLIFSSSDRDPGVFYLFDGAKKKLDELAVVKPAIDPDKMAPMKEVTFKARDGLTIHAYLTLPLGREPKKLPLILHPHGGPYGIRDDWGFDPEVQFYANRGYAVLQVNYRGSGGYGAHFQRIGWKKWGLDMQNDLTDAVQWAIAQGMVDPARVVISGASYGGYATMAGLVFTPELYCAGINYAGVVDINELIPRGGGGSDGRDYWYATRIGDLENTKDRKRMHDTSPVNFVERIRVPVLMAYGRNDPRVRRSQGVDIEVAMKKADKTYEMILEEDEGHGFRMEEKRIAFFTRVDEFLKKHVSNAQ